MDTPNVVYVITDAEPPRNHTPNPLDALAPTLVAVPFLATTALVVGLLAGWPLPLLVIAAIGSLPIAANAVDLMGAHLGWPPLSWTAAKILARHRPPQEGPTDA